jgi:hypothetical protein
MSQNACTLLEEAERKSLPEGVKRRVLVTGAAGRIGSYFASKSTEQYDLRLMVRESDENVERLHEFGEVVTCDLTDLPGLKQVCEGIDTIVHLGGNPAPHATWAELLPPNIIGVYNIFVAAKASGCRRVIFASSIHAVTGYPHDYQMRTSDMIRPTTLYGVTKCFGEAMSRYMAEQEGVSAIAIRICGYNELEWVQAENSLGWSDLWVSPDDMNQLISRCIDNGTIKFAIVNGLSDNRYKRMDLTDTKELLGYDPQDDSAKQNPLLKPVAIHQKPHVHDPAAELARSGLREDL